MIRNKEIFFKKVRNIPLTRHKITKKGEFIFEFGKIVAKKIYCDDEKLPHLYEKDDVLVNVKGDKYKVCVIKDDSLKLPETDFDYLILIKFNDKYEVMLMAEFTNKSLSSFSGEIKIDDDLLRRASLIC